MDISILNLPAQKEAQFRKKGINTIKDLVYFFPVRYIDARNPKSIKDITDGETALMFLRIVRVFTAFNGALTITAEDSNGDRMRITWYNADYMRSQVDIGLNIAIIAKFNVHTSAQSRFVETSNPIRFSTDRESLRRILPIYKKIAGMSDTYLESCITLALSMYHPEEYLDGDTLIKEKVIPQETAIRRLHMPESANDVKSGKLRMLFDDLLFFNLMLKEKSIRQNPGSPYIFKSSSLAQKYIKSLKFDLTQGQKEAVAALYKTGSAGKRVSALIQADVGYGKTECAKIFSLMGVECGCQTVMLAPTMVLAQQHYKDFSETLSPLGVRVGYLSSELKARDRKKLLKELKDGEIDVLVGTHSCLSDSVEYKNLGLVVVDEEHKFGVRQREKLTMIAERGVHSLSMSATPIPRSLAIALYGDGIDVIDIKTAPAFKKPIETKIVKTDEEILKTLIPEMNEGHQVYIVCPLIEESGNEKMASVEDVTSVTEKYQKLLAPYTYKVALLNGKMKKDDISATIKDFVENKIQILVSTTVVEVGVNVPNATVMVIKNAERFGLAQLHQLRGRVGRGAFQGKCLLQSVDERAQEGLGVLCESNDGFYIAQKDLEMRGAGDFIGTSQSGDNIYVEEMMKFPKYNQHIRSLVTDIYKNEQMKEYFEDYFRKEFAEIAADSTDD